MIVFVIDGEGTPLLPTHPARARKLLQEGKAVIKQVVPFTIQLNRKVDNPVGSFEMGVDDGAKYVGIAVKNNQTQEVVLHAKLDHRQDVSRKVGERRIYRRARRYRIRYRSPRYSNRIKFKLAPSIRQRKEAILRVIKDLNKRLNLVKVKVEEVSFNHAKHNWGRNFSLVEVGKNYLREQIQHLGFVYESTHGYITKETRLKLGLNKKHSHDACAILESNELIGREYVIKPRRTKPSPSRRCTEQNGFRHYDLVKSSRGSRKVVIGSIRSLCSRLIFLRTKWNSNFSVSYSKTKLLCRFGGLIYSW